MKAPVVISINPVAKPLGVLRSERIRHLSTLPNIVSHISVTPRLKETLNLLTGINTPAVNGFSGRLFLLRFLTSVMMITSAVLLFLSGGDMMLALPLAILGASLLLGFGTRIFSFAGVVYFAFAAYHAMFDVPTCALVGFASLVFMISGPGIYSIDQCLRKWIFRQARRRAKYRALKSRNYNPEMTYKCYMQI